jgi:hypothetical protein
MMPKCNRAAPYKSPEQVGNPTENLAAAGCIQPFREGKSAYISIKQQKCPEKLSGTLFA